MIVSPEHVRSFFNEHLTYSDISEIDIEVLSYCIGLECAKRYRVGDSMRMWLPKEKCYQPIVRMSKEHNGIQEAYLRISGKYFKGREAISFNRDGFVGFAGWSDESNVKPFLFGFLNWMNDWMGVPVEALYRGKE